MKKYISSILVTLAILLSSISTSYAAQDCVSEQTINALRDVIGPAYKIIIDGKHVEKVVNNRTVMQLFDSEIPLGKPPKYLGTHGPTRDLIEKEGWTNLRFMEAGRPPIGSDGYPIEMHHMYGEEPGQMAELLRTVHQGNKAALHVMIKASLS